MSSLPTWLLRGDCTSLVHPRPRHEAALGSDTCDDILALGVSNHSPSTLYGGWVATKTTPVQRSHLNFRKPSPGY